MYVYKHRSCEDPGNAGSDLKVKENLKDPSKFAVVVAPVVVLKLIIVSVYIYMH